jgi:catechol 2,3-dioxygenase-like lactoylglutathione lyase family enzyme
MTVKLNHTIVAAHDHAKSALFLTEILGLEPPSILGPFALVPAGDGLTLDFMKTDGEITSQHYAFLVSETEFDQIFARIKQRGLTYWADPHQTMRDQINQWDDGRGVYFEDPNGHLLEILTRPYGSAGTSAQHPHPLVLERLSPQQSGSDMDDAKAIGKSKLGPAEQPDSSKSRE